MTLALLLIPVVLCGLWGWFKGAMRVVTRLSVLLLAYALTWQETPALVELITSKQWLSGVYAWPVASGSLFVAGSVIFSLCAAGLVHIAPDEWKHGGKSIGAFLGGILGAVIGLVLFWTVGITQDAIARRQQAETRNDTALPAATHPAQPARSATDQQLQALAASAVSSAASAVMGDSPAAALAGEMMRSPLSVGEGFKHMAEQQDLRMLVQDPASYAVLVQGTPEDVMRLPYFRALVADAELMQFLKSTGLTGNTPAELELNLAGKLSAYTRNFEYIRLTPEYQALTADPNFQAQLKAGQWLQLLGNDKARQLAEMLINPGTVIGNQTAADKPVGFTIRAPGQAQWTSTAAPPAETPQDDTDSSAPPSKTIYRWKDASGRMHLSDEKPPEGIPADVLVE